MSDIYLIEVAGRAVGLVARETDRAYRFHAAVPPAFALEGRRFRTPGEAEEAVRNVLKQTKAAAKSLNHAA